MGQTLETRRSTEKELLHRWALMSTRFDYYEIWSTTEPSFERNPEDNAKTNWLSKEAMPWHLDTTWQPGSSEEEVVSRSIRNHTERSAESQLLHQRSNKPRLPPPGSSTPRLQPHSSKAPVLTNRHAQTSPPCCQQPSSFRSRQKSSGLASGASFTKLRLCTSVTLLLNEHYKAISWHRNRPPLHTKCCVRTQEFCKSHRN